MSQNENNEFEEPMRAEAHMGFHVADSDQMEEAVRELDDFVVHLCHQDHLARLASVNGDMEAAQNVSMAVTHAVTGIPWGQIPTVIMHCAAQINAARRAGGSAVEAAKRVGEGLKTIAAELNNYGVPADVCMRILDMGVGLISVCDEFPYEKFEE